MPGTRGTDMQPDVKKEQRNGWLVLGAAAMLSLVCVGWYSYDDPLAERLDKAKTDYNKMRGPEPMSTHIRRQQQANQTLSQTIEDLKKDSGALVADYFTITDADLRNGDHESSIFNAKYHAVKDECDAQAFAFGLKHWGEHSSLGFSDKEQLPTDAEAPYMLTMLQLTRRAARICFSSPPGEVAMPIKDLEFIHELKQRPPTGPPGRPPLLTEYPLTVKFTASLTQTMWIIWRFSVGKVDELQQPSDPKNRIEDSRGGDDSQASHPWDDGAYPFALQEVTIVSPVTEELKINEEPNTDLTVTLRLAAMRFLPSSNRDTAVPAGGRAPAASAPANQPAESHIDYVAPMGHPAPRN